MRLEAAGASARNMWESVVAADPHALVSQTPAWLDCVCALGRYEDATRAYRADDGRLLVLPLARARGVPPAAAVESSMPHGWSSGGLLCSDGRVTPADVAAVVRELKASCALSITVRPGPEEDPAWAAAVRAPLRRTTHTSYSLDLSGGFDEVWTHRFGRKVRSWCRKAEHRLTVEWDDCGRLIPVFDALYRNSVLRWARQQHEPLPLARWRARRQDPRRKFELVAERLGPACRVGVAWRAGEPAASVIVLEHGGQSKYWRGAMDKELSAGTGANELLHQMAIERACRSGRRVYDMGETRPDSGLARFKRSFGAEETEFGGYYVERLPLSRAEEFLRRQVKRAVGFRD